MLRERLFGKAKEKQIVKPESSGRGNILTEVVNQNLQIAKGARKVHLGNMEFGIVGSGSEAFFRLNDLRLGRVHCYESSQGELFYKPKDINGKPIAESVRIATEAECALIIYAMRVSPGFGDKTR